MLQMDEGGIETHMDGKVGASKNGLGIAWTPSLLHLPDDPDRNTMFTSGSQKSRKCQLNVNIADPASQNRHLRLGQSSYTPHEDCPKT